MKKLTKEQQRVIDDARAQVENARNSTFEDWASTEGFDIVRYPVQETVARKAWEEAKAGVAYTRCNTNTVKVLENLGLIKIIVDGTGKRRDMVQVIDF